MSRYITKIMYLDLPKQPTITEGVQCNFVTSFPINIYPVGFAPPPSALFHKKTTIHLKWCPKLAKSMMLLIPNCCWPLRIRLLFPLAASRCILTSYNWQLMIITKLHLPIAHCTDAYGFNDK